MAATSTLKTEFENAKIIDFRDPENPNNTIVITVNMLLMISQKVIAGLKTIENTL